MKPKMTMDEKPPAVIITDPQAYTTKATSGSKLMIVRATIGLLGLIVIVGVSVGAFYLGMNAERESISEAWVNFKTGANNTIIKERVIVSEKEAEFRRPGVMSMVVDYENSVVVMQYDHELKGDEQVYCYLYQYEPGMFGTHEDAKSIVNGDETNLIGSKADERLIFESTGEHVPLEQLSPRAREMCRGAEILRVRKSHTEGRKKRSVTIECYVQCFPCRIICRENASSGRKTLIVGAVIGLLGLVVIAVVSIGAFYLGMNAERESVKDVWVNLKPGVNNTIIKERVIVSETEAEFRRPGVMNMVVDYENNVLVMQYDRKLEGDEDIYCYVYDYESGMFGTHEDAEAIANGDETHLTGPRENERFIFESTGEHVPLDQLSPRAREMCRGSEILRVRKADKEARVKRRIGLECVLSCCPWRFYCRLSIKVMA